MLHTRILGTGFVTGEHLIKNDDLTKMMDTSDQWIRERSGVEERYYVEAGTSTSDLGVAAARKALDDAGVAAADVDYIVFATMTPDHFFPGCGGILQHKLGLGHVPAGPAPTEQEKAWNSRFRDRTVLFGDAAGAVVLRAAEGDRGLLGFKVHSDGADLESLYVKSCGFAQRPYVTERDLHEGRHIPEMNGKHVFKLAVTRMPQVVREVCDANGVHVQDIDLLIAHQANLRINEMVQRVLELPDAKVFNNIQRYGNTTAATIPIAFDEARRAGRVKDGDLVRFVGLGAGFHWGAALLRA